MKMTNYIDLSIAKRARDPRSTLSVLQCVRIGNGMLVSSDMEQYYSRKIDIEGGSEKPLTYKIAPGLRYVVRPLIK